MSMFTAAQQASNWICICNKLLNTCPFCDTGKAANNLLPYNGVNLSTRAQHVNTTFNILPVRIHRIKCIINKILQTKNTGILTYMKKILKC